MTNTWLTPLWLVDALGLFDLDPCAVPGHYTALFQYCLDEGMDGLANEWPTTQRVWLNPPYGKGIIDWLKKLENHGNGIALVFARTDTKWFHELKPEAIFFMKARVKFLDHNFKENSNAGAPSMLLAWGMDNIVAIKNSGLKGKLVLC